MDKDGNQVDTDDTKWKKLGQGVSTSIVAAFDPSIASKSHANIRNTAVLMTWCN
jgi:hypothetical protein